VASGGNTTITCRAASWADTIPYTLRPSSGANTPTNGNGTATPATPRTTPTFFFSTFYLYFRFSRVHKAKRRERAQGLTAAIGRRAVGV
jgi:hypothetical protein